MTVIETLKDKTETLKMKAGVLWASAHELNKLAVDKLEETSSLGLASASFYSGVGIKQLRAVSSVKDMETMRAFTADSITLSGEIAKKVMDDSKSLLSIGAGVKDKITSMFPRKAEEVVKKKTAKPVAA